MSYTFTPDEMNSLSDAQKDALIDTVISGLCADGALKSEEVARLDDEFIHLAWGRTKEAMEAAIRASYEKIRAFTEPQQAVEMIKHVAATLTDQTVREKAFAMLARVMYDGQQMSVNEQTVLTAFCVAFQIQLPRLKEIGEAVKSGR